CCKRKMEKVSSAPSAGVCTRSGTTYRFSWSTKPSSIRHDRANGKARAPSHFGTLHPFPYQNDTLCQHSETAVGPDPRSAAAARILEYAATYCTNMGLIDCRRFVASCRENSSTRQ